MEIVLELAEVVLNVAVVLVLAEVVLNVAVVVATPDGGELGAEGRVFARRLEDGSRAVH